MYGGETQLVFSMNHRNSISLSPRKPPPPLSDSQEKIIIQTWHYLSFWLLCYVNDPTKQGIIYCFMNIPINIYIKCSGIFHREFFAILNILCNILIFILYYKSWASSWQPFWLALGPSCLLDFVLRAQRARRLCDPRNDALDSEKSNKNHPEIQKNHPCPCPPRHRHRRSCCPCPLCWRV